MDVPAPGSRREQILLAAAALFAERGFHAVGVDDVGLAAGISGPGVYRHFAGKQALLEALCERAMTRMVDGARGIEARSGTADVQLERLLALHVRFVLQERPLIGVWVREARALSDEARRTVRAGVRAYERPWRTVLAELREDLRPSEVAFLTTSTLAMLNATALQTPDLRADELERLLEQLAVGALLSRHASVAAALRSSRGERLVARR